MDAYAYARDYDISEVNIAKFGGMTLTQLQGLDIENYFAVLEAKLVGEENNK